MKTFRQLLESKFPEQKIPSVIPPREARDKMRAHLKAGWTAPHKTEHLDPHNVHGTQNYIWPHRLKDVSDAPIKVLRHEGKDYVGDGHHRLEKAKQEGRKIAAHVYE